MRTLLFSLIFLVSMNAFSQNKALNFNGTSSQVTVSNNAALSPATLTVEAWINATAWRAEYWRGTIIGFDDPSDNGYVLRSGNGGKLDFTIITSTGYASVLSTSSMTAGEWYHVAGVFDGTNIKIYINGVLEGTTTTTGTLTASTADFLIGQSPSGWNERFFNGKIDEVRVWNVARTPQQLIDNKNGVTAPQAGLVGYWKFDNDVTDISGNNLNGTNSGAVFADAGWNSNMEFTSATCLQSAISSQTGLDDQSILKVKVVVTNSLVPFSLTSMLLNMTGTTDVSDASQLNVYYTGNSQVFSSSTLFATTTPATGDLTLTGSQQLLEGDNYFWVTCNVSPTAVVGHVLDAQCTSLTLNGGVGTKVPTVTAPDGVLTIVADHNEALQFDGVLSKVTVAKNALLEPTTAFTVEAWINATNWRSIVDNGTIVAKDLGAGYVLRCGGSGKLQFVVNNGAWKVVTSTSTMITGKWYHVAGVYDGTVVKLYIDGVLEGSLAATGSVVNSNVDFMIGQSPNSNDRHFDGKIDEVRYWNVARTQQQLIDNKLVVTAPQAGLVGYWKFRSSLKDISGNNLNGVNTNAVFVDVDWDKSGTITVNKLAQSIEQTYKIYKVSTDLMVESLSSNSNAIRIEVIGIDGKILLSRSTNAKMTSLPIANKKGNFIIRIISNDKVQITKIIL